MRWSHKSLQGGNPIWCAQATVNKQIVVLLATLHWKLYAQLPLPPFQAASQIHWRSCMMSDFICFRRASLLKCSSSRTRFRLKASQRLRFSCSFFRWMFSIRSHLARSIFRVNSFLDKGLRVELREAEVCLCWFLSCMAMCFCSRRSCRQFLLSCSLLGRYWFLSCALIRCCSQTCRCLHRKVALASYPAWIFCINLVQSAPAISHASAKAFCNISHASCKWAGVYSHSRFLWPIDLEYWRKGSKHRRICPSFSMLRTIGVRSFREGPMKKMQAWDTQKLSFRSDVFIPCSLAQDAKASRKCFSNKALLLVLSCIFCFTKVKTTKKSKAVWKSVLLVYTWRASK